MRAAIWLLALFAVAAAVALFAGNNQGTITVFWPPWRVDLSLNLVLVILLLTFVLLHVALRALAALFSLPTQARHWRLQQKERMLHSALLDAMVQLIAGRFSRARKAAQAALTQEKTLAALGAELPQAQQVRVLSHLLAAESAQALQDKAARDAHLQQALNESADRTVLASPETREGVQLRAARWALDDRDPTAALARLEELPQGAQRRTLALRLRLKAARQDRRTVEALDTARLLAKHRAFSPAAAASVVRGLVLESINEARDTTQLQHFWLSLDTEERAMPEIALPAASRLMALGGEASQARAWLLPVWERLLSHAGPRSESHLPRLVQVLEPCLDGLDGTWLARIEAATNSHPREPRLQYLAGMACVQRQLWGKAQQLLLRAAPHLQESALRTRAWQRLALMAEHRGDADAAAAAWKQAAQAVVMLPADPARP